MEWIAGLDLVQAANALVILIVGLAAGLGWRQGKRTPPATSVGAQVSVEAALVDSSAVRALTAAVEAFTAESVSARADSERLRRLGHQLIDALKELTGELEEIRTEMRMGRR